jgi:hypothetical protein
MAAGATGRQIFMGRAARTRRTCQPAIRMRGSIATADFLVELRGFEPLISVARAPCAPRGWSHAKNAVRDHVRGQAPRVITNRPRHQISDIPLCRTAESSTKRDSSWEQRIDRAQMRQSNLHFWPSRRSGSDDRMPEERSEKSNHNNAKDKTPRFENRGGVVARGQPVGIAHAKLLGRPPASQPHQTLIKIS